jgi:NAD(P)-dependent dehydrogenase (short-subunit alcohol dehydrogenase family)
MADFDGKVALVTGGSKGMGRAAATRLAAGGASVLVFANDRPSVEDVAAEIGSAARGFVGDVSTAGDVAAAVAAAVTAFGGLDILVCSAGIQRYGTVVDTPEEVWDQVLDVNLKGVYLAARAAIPEMRKRGGGSIVAISSVQAFASQESVAAYTASKGGINALVRAMALDHAREGITVNAVCPASVDTPMLRWAADLYKGEGSADELIALWGRAHPVGRVGRPEEIAEAIAFLAGPHARFITGTELKVDGGVLAKLGIVLPE